MNRLRTVLLSSLLVVAALVFAACGGGDEKGGGGGGGEPAGSGADVNELLTQTFGSKKEVKSGNVDMSLKVEVQGSSTLQGPVDVTLKGPFQSQEAALPKFNFEASLEGAGQSYQAGATSTGDKGFVSFMGKDYVLDDQVFQQFKAGYEEARKAGEQQDAQSFASLGMDPRKWLTDPQNAGEAKVGDADTIKITGGVDLAKLLDDVNNALSNTSALGLPAGQVPEKLTDAQRQQVIEAIKDPKVEIYTGKDDTILRRLVVSMGVQDSNSGTSGTFAMDIAITDLNEDQEIAEPADPLPFNELMGQLGGLGIGGGAATGDPAAAQTVTPSGSEDLEKYSKCVTDAGEDLEAARKCADLLGS